MEASGYKETLEEARKSGKAVKLMFHYPSATRSTKKSGRVISVEDTSFTIEEVQDGRATYAYKFLIECTEATQ